ncbi:MAG: Na+/H+ antiporter subunit E [Rhodothalassiaceae bacterium]
MLRTLVLLIALAVTWLLWSGHYDPFLLTLGTISILLTLYLARRMALIDRSTMPIQLGFGIVTYWGWLLKEIAVSNYRVARAILSPDLRIQPKLHKVDALPSSTLGRVIFGNSITLTPGTVTLDMAGSELMVHALEDPGAQGFDAMNRRVADLEK